MSLAISSRLTSAFGSPAKYRSAACYGIVAFAPAAATLLLTPLLIRELGKAGFAEWALLEPLLALGTAALACGVQYGVLQNAAANPTSRLPGSPFFVVAGLFPALLLALCTLRGRYSAGVLIALSIAQAMDAFATIQSNHYRGQGRSGHMAVLEGGRQCLIILSALGVACFAPSLFSVKLLLWARAAATALFVASLAPRALAGDVPSMPLRVRQLIAYGTPIFGGQLLAIGLNAGDRYVAGFAGVGAAGLTTYVAHLRLASVVNLLVAAPLALWYPARVLAQAPEMGAPLFRKVNLFTVVAIGLALVSAEIAALLFWKPVFPGIGFSPLLLAGLIGSIGFQALSTVWNVGALQPGRTKANIVPPALAVVTLLVVSSIGARYSGIDGLAAGRLLAMAVYAFTFAGLSVRIVRFSVAPRLQSLALAVGALLVGAVLLTARS